ncbi:MAG: aminoacyl-tRNA hydrolase [Clostridia bacterium]|jgi:PTH1 family peptidyl-tRNA hydrolase|nr:aminoacyl-tRNA hydrolase [Clostridia bacterium]
MKMIVGLGNPGTRYEKTRHNVGFMIIDAFAASYQLKIDKKQGRSLVGLGFIEQEKVLLVKPQTYMNRSGEAVWEILNYYREGIEDFLVIHDDLDLDFGRLRFKRGGGSGGHNGLKSITQMLNSPEYSRCKVGIGRPPEFMQAEDYVLGSFLERERGLLPEIIKGSLAGLKAWFFEGIDEAMNKWNSFNIELEKKED